MRIVPIQNGYLPYKPIKKTAIAMPFVPLSYNIDNDNKTVNPIMSYNIPFTGYQCSEESFKIKSLYDVPCPCCGKTMLTQKQNSLFVSKIADKTGEDLREEFKKWDKFLGPSEKAIVGVLDSLSIENPNLGLQALVALQAQSSKSALEQTQLKIIKDLKRKLQNTKIPNKKEIRWILTNAENKIKNDKDSNEHFKRKEFIEQVSLARGDSQSKEYDDLIEIARKIPTSSSSMDAFFVKYSRRGASEITQRLLDGSLSTTEHIKPKSKQGENSTENYIAMCKSCNSARGNIPYLKWFEYHPEMPANLQKYINRINEAVLNGELINFPEYNSYVTEVIDTIHTETGGKLNLVNPNDAPDFEIEDTIEHVSIEWQRQQWMDRCEEIKAKLDELLEQREKLYADKEFLNILYFSEIENKAGLLARKKRERLDSLNYAKSAVNIAKSQLNKAIEQQEGSNAVKKYQAKLDRAKSSEQNALDEFLSVKQKHSEANAELYKLKAQITTPSDIQNEIRILEEKITRRDTVQGKISGLKEKIDKEDTLIAESEEIDNKIDEIQGWIDETSIGINANSPDNIERKKEYDNIKKELEIIDSQDVAAFNRTTKSKYGINPDFILKHAKSHLKLKLRGLSNNPYVKILIAKDEVGKLLQRQKEITAELHEIRKSRDEVKKYEQKLDKVTTEFSGIDPDKRLEYLKLRKQEVQYKFANVNIDSTIAHIQELYNDVLQKIADSYENPDFENKKATPNNSSI